MAQKKPPSDTPKFLAVVFVIVLAIILYFLIFGKYLLPAGGHG